MKTQHGTSMGSDSYLWAVRVNNKFFLSVTVKKVTLPTVFQQGQQRLKKSRNPLSIKELRYFFMARVFIRDLLKIQVNRLQT